MDIIISNYNLKVLSKQQNTRILPLRISRGRGAIDGIEYGESNWEAKPGAILSHT